MWHSNSCIKVARAGLTIKQNKHVLKAPRGGGTTEIFHCQIYHGPYGAKLQMVQLNQGSQKGAPTINEKLHTNIYNNKNNSKIVITEVKDIH